MWLIYAISAAAIWGLDYSLGEKVLKSKISPISLMTLQMGIGTLVFLVIGYRLNLKQDLQLFFTDRKVMGLGLAAVASFNIGNLLIFLSIQAKNATAAGLVELAYPIFTALFTYLLFKENHLTPGLVIGGLFILTGIVVVSLYA